MKRLLAALLGLAASGSGGCQSCPPEARARLLAPDFDTPEATGRTFWSALSCSREESAEVEYMSLSEALKQRFGATLDLYILGRPRLLEEIGPAVKLAWKLEPLGREPQDGRILVWWGLASRSGPGRPIVGLVLEEQHYAELVLEGGREPGTFLDEPPGAYVAVEGRRLAVEVEDAAFRGVRPDEIRKFTIGSEWKIYDFLQPEDDAIRP